MNEERGKGTVFLAFDDGRYWGYWDLLPDGPPTQLERCPESPDLGTVLTWGRARTPVVIVRPEADPAHDYWAGLGEPPEDHRHLAPLPDPRAG